MYKCVNLVIVWPNSQQEYKLYIKKKINTCPLNVVEPRNNKIILL